MTSSSRTSRWTLLIVSVGLFMTVLDNLVVNVALPSIHRELGSSIQALEWTVNAYVLSYAVFLLTGAALGDRFGRKRMFTAGIALFTLSSAAAAVAPTTGMLIAARAAQGLGAAIVTPLTLTLLADAFPPQRRGVAIGVWSAISGIAVALGPLVGGAVVQIASWHYIFWINVPVGAVLIPLSLTRLNESHGASRRLDLPGLGARIERPVRNRLRSRSLAVTRLGLHAGTRPAGIRRSAGDRLRRVRAPDHRPDAPDALLHQAKLRSHERRLAGDVLRNVRLDLLPEPVPAERAPQHPAAGRREAAGLDRRLDGRLAAGRLLLGALRQPDVHGRGADAPGGRTRVARDAGQCPPELREHDRSVHPRRLWDGARVRALGQRRALLGPDGRGGPGVGRDQCDPRARRRARDRDPGDRVHKPRWLHLAPGVRPRADAGDVGRRGRPRGRRADRRGAPLQQHGRGGARKSIRWPCRHST